MSQRVLRKCREARFFLASLQRELRNLSGDNEPLLFYLSAFLSAGRSVTFSMQKEGKEKYDGLFETWKGRLSPEDSAVLILMNEQRTEEVHRSGAQIASGNEDVPVYDVYEDERSRIEVFGPPAGITGQTGALAVVHRPTWYFLVAGAQREVGDVCNRYVELLEALVRSKPDFDTRVSSLPPCSS